jgi:hypothetical protein
MSGNRPQTRVFVYGSLLDPRRQREVVGRELRMLSARLPGYERRRGRYFYIVPRANVETPGAILLDIGASDLQARPLRRCPDPIYSRDRHRPDRRRRRNHLLVLRTDRPPDWNAVRNRAT